MNILNKNQTVVKDEFSYFKINSIGNVTGYDAVNLPDGMTIYKPDGYIYGIPTKKQTKHSVLFIKNEKVNTYKIINVQVIDSDVINLESVELINGGGLKVFQSRNPSGQAINLNLNNILSGYYEGRASSQTFKTSSFQISNNTGFNQVKFFNAGIPSLNPILLETNLFDISGMSIGYDHALAFTISGKITGWGNNSSNKIFGGLYLTGVIGVGAGKNHSLALLANGKVTGWGDNTYNQAAGGNNLTNVSGISAGAYHSLALFNNQTVTGWGEDTYSKAIGGNILTGVIQIAGGSGHSLALLQNKKVTGWGDNSYQQVTGGDYLTGVSKISVFHNTNVALLDTKAVVNWGFGEKKSLCYADIPVILPPIVVPGTSDPGINPPVVSPEPEPPLPQPCVYVDLSCNSSNKYQAQIGLDSNNCPVYGCIPCPPAPSCPNNKSATFIGKDANGCNIYQCVPCDDPYVTEPLFNLVYFLGDGNVSIQLFPVSNWTAPKPKLIWGDITSGPNSEAEILPSNLIGTKNSWNLNHDYYTTVVDLVSIEKEIIDYDEDGCPIYGKYVYTLNLSNPRSINLKTNFPFPIKSGDKVIFKIIGNAGGTLASNLASIDTGYWPAGVYLKLIVPSVKGGDGCNPYEGVVAGKGAGYCYLPKTPGYTATNAIIIRNGVVLIIENHGIIGGGGKQGQDNPCCCGEGGGGAGIPGGGNNGGGGKSCCGGEGNGSILCGGGGGGGAGTGGGLNSQAGAVALEGNGTYIFSSESTRPFFG